MVELYVNLFQGLEHNADLEQWGRKNAVLHNALHEKLLNASECSVCAGSKLRQDTRWQRAGWSLKAVGLLWDLTASTIREHGTGWQAWRPTHIVGVQQSPPPFLQNVEDIPRDMIQELPGGVFKWGRYLTPPGTETLDAAFLDLNTRWRGDRARRIDIIREAGEQQGQRPQKQPGDKLLLQQDGHKESYSGRVWRSEEQWSFQEEGTGIEVTAAVNPDHSIRQRYQQCEAKLFKAMRGEHVKRKQARSKAAKLEAGKADTPKTTSDMTVKGKTPQGKLVYAWGDSDKGRVEVQVTPRALREPEQEDASAFQRATCRETTPERALRKMTAKLQKVRAKARRGQQERIVVRAPADSSTPRQQPERIPEETYAPALRTLNDPNALQHVIDAFEFLASLRLHYCSNCDEEWPVFDTEWPQTGVAWVGHKAGKCETIGRAGFRASTKDPARCSRCDAPTAYRKMYCEENLQHLGIRRAALSALTWYESLLMARVHPVMSVVTLTATGLLCFAGHVCNYYVKVMEWMRALPAVLRDKKWFLIKRRRSIRAGTTDTRQKKPTTANYYRLLAAIRDVMEYMPRVYAGSVFLPEELNKFPRNGEQEMLEQEESVDLSGEVHVPQEVFVLWYASGETSAAPRPCAAVVCRYTMDQQGLDFRGSVSADTAWELCCRLLSLQPEQNKIGTRDLAQLLVYWLEEGQVPSQMAHTIYDGMEADLLSRNKRNETVD